MIGLQIAASSILFTVGETASLTCSSDLDVSSIEWLYSGQQVANSTGQQQLELVFSPVNDTIHDREYTCRVTSPYGTQEDAHLVIAEGKYCIMINMSYCRGVNPTVCLEMITACSILQSLQTV